MRLKSQVVYHEALFQSCDTTNTHIVRTEQNRTCNYSVSKSHH